MNERNDDDGSIPRTPSSPPRQWGIRLILAIVSLGVFSESLDYSLVYDDVFLISNNASMWPIADDLTAAFDLFGQEYWEGVNPERAEVLRTRGQALYRPLTVFLWGVVYWATGGNEFLVPGGSAWPYHALNLLVHLAVVLLLHHVIRRLTGSGRMAFVTALLFAVHPLHTEAVAYVAGLSDLLAAATILGGLSLFLSATEKPGGLATRPFLGLLAVMFIGMTAKEQAVLLLPVCILTDLMWNAKGRGLEGSTRFILYGSMTAIVVIQLGLRFMAVGYLTPDTTAIDYIDNPLIQEPFDIRFINGMGLLAMQVWLFLWPEVLSIDYSFDAIPMAQSLFQPAPLAGLVLIAALALFGLLRMGRQPFLCWGILFFVGCSAFTANILVPIGTIFGERLTYVPTIGACLAVAALFEFLLATRTGGNNPLGAALLLGITIPLGMQAMDHTRNFQSTLQLFESAHEVVPQSARVHYQLGSLYGNEQLYSKAEQHYTSALEIRPQFIQAAIGLGDVYTRDKRYDQGIETYNRVLATVGGPEKEKVNEVRRLVYHKRGVAKLGNGDPEGAEADMRSAASLARGDWSSQSTLARLLMNSGRPAEAIPVIRGALEKAPDRTNLLYLMIQAAMATPDPEAYEEALDRLENTEAGKPFAISARAEVQYEEAMMAGDANGKLEALQMFEEVRRLKPDMASPYIHRGRWLMESGRYPEALIELDKSLDRYENHPAALLFKGTTQLAMGQPEEALTTLRLLESIKPDENCLRMLASTYANLAMVDEMETTYERLREMGVEPADLIWERALALEKQGYLDRAIDVFNQGLALPGLTENAQLIRGLAILQMKAGRFEEALGSFILQEEVERMNPDLMVDPFLPVNRARALMGLDRDVEAAAQLSLFESTLEEGAIDRTSLLHRQAELFLKENGPFFQPAKAVSNMEEALFLSGGTYPPYYDLCIEAQIVAGDILGAMIKASEASEAFPQLSKTYAALEAALDRATMDDGEGAAETLLASDVLLLQHLGTVLKAHP
ncbi:MAG: tetratricopeptide repeat protein [Planctomycetota bacterium]|nr:tetratricopeptide repeat protein [Planctomycetota bacterium]